MGHLNENEIRLWGDLRIRGIDPATPVLRQLTRRLEREAREAYTAYVATR